jgi:protein-disulfide isomerase
MRKRLDFVTGFLILCAGTMTTLALRNYVAGRAGAPSPPAQMRAIDNWMSLALPSRAVGSASGRVTIIEFSDFQCPFCQKLFENLETLRSEHPDSIRIIFRYLPLTRIHPLALATAIGAECARAQGRFEAFHNLAFQKQDSLSSIPVHDLARRAGVSDSVAFASCFVSAKAEAIVRFDMAVADSLRILGTPGVIVDGNLYRGSPPLEDLRRLVTMALAKR